MSQFRQIDDGIVPGGGHGMTPGGTDRLEWVATAITSAVYFVYILAIAFDPESLGKPVVAGSTITWGAAGGVGVIVFSIVIAIWYAGRANRAERG